MNAEEFLKTKGIGKLTIKAVRLPHKYKNIELELIPLMEEYAELKLLGIANVVGRSEQCRHDNETITDKDGFEVCPDCEKWGENC